MGKEEIRDWLRLLYIGLKYDYGQSERGLSYEYVNILGTLRKMAGVRVEFFPLDVVMRESGRSEMNRRLVRAVEELSPDCCYFVLFTDEIERKTIELISEKGNSATLNWFGDDHWRFDSFSKMYAPAFHWVLTTDSCAVEKYHALGCRNVFKTQWGFNPYVCERRDVREEFDVTFVGQVHSRRRRIVDHMRKGGIDVRCWGRGWKAGRLSEKEMVAVYSRSRINLNFTGSSVSLGWKPIAKVFLNRRADDSISINSPAGMWGHLRVLLGDLRPQIKGRNFEIPGSGGFLLTSDADNLGEYFVPGKEIAVFNGLNDLMDKTRHYLAHADEREAIREAGYERAHREHTYEQRLRSIFAAIGFAP
jgi:spore maturation protein CgeB